MTEKLYRIGSWHVFKIIKTIKIPYDRSYYILIDINKNKFLLPEEYYRHYDLTINTLIVCRIDRINCSGRIFLEPVNPFYHEGEIHDFKFVRFDRLSNKSKILKNVIIVRDYFGKESVLTDYYIGASISDILRCKIIRIKKGKLFLKLV